MKKIFYFEKYIKTFQIYKKLSKITKFFKNSFKNVANITNKNKFDFVDI